MSKNRFFLLFLVLSFVSNSFAQTHANEVEKEIDKLSLSVIKHHLNDSFYLQLRPLPGVRFETRNYILMYNGKKWKGTFSNNCLAKEGCTIKSQKISVKETEAATIAHNIDFTRLLDPNISDSVKIAGPSVLGGSNYFMIICSKRKLRKIEYLPSVWQSNYLESVLRELEKLAQNAKRTERK